MATQAKKIGGLLLGIGFALSGLYETVYTPPSSRWEKAQALVMAFMAQQNRVADACLSYDENDQLRVKTPLCRQKLDKTCPSMQSYLDHGFIFVMAKSLGDFCKQSDFSGAQAQQPPMP